MSDICRMPIIELSPDIMFVTQCHQMGFEKLEDILMLSSAELLATEGFTYSWLGELTGLLNRYRILHLLQTTPGRTSG